MPFGEVIAFGVLVNRIMYCTSQLVALNKIHLQLFSSLEFIVLQSLFDYIDIGRVVKPGSYRLVKLLSHCFPERVLNIRRYNLGT